MGNRPSLHHNPGARPSRRPIVHRLTSRSSRKTGELCSSGFATSISTPTSEPSATLPRLTHPSICHSASQRRCLLPAVPRLPVPISVPTLAVLPEEGPVSSAATRRLAALDFLRRRPNVFASRRRRSLEPKAGCLRSATRIESGSGGLDCPAKSPEGRQGSPDLPPEFCR